MRQVLLLTIILVIALAAQACARTVTVRGKISDGSSTSGVDSPNPSCCGFTTDSEVVDAIFKKCKSGDECNVVGDVNSDGWIVSVSNVRKVDTTLEPSAEVIKAAACKSLGFYNKSCSGIYSGSSVDVQNMYMLRHDKEVSWVVEFDLVYIDKDGVGKTVYKNNKMSLVKCEDGWRVNK